MINDTIEVNKGITYFLLFFYSISRATYLALTIGYTYLASLKSYKEKVSLKELYY
jgi:hypothetical protein